VYVYVKRKYPMTSLIRPQKKELKNWPTMKAFKEREPVSRDKREVKREERKLNFNEYM